MREPFRRSLRSHTLYSGVVPLAASAMLVAPAFHRLLRRFPLEASRE